MVHIVGCFWYYTAVLDEFGPDTWVFRYDYLDSDDKTLYIASIYWVFSTITTVGYGDIVPFTQLERVFTLFLMGFGVG